MRDISPSAGRAQRLAVRIDAGSVTARNALARLHKIAALDGPD